MTNNMAIKYASDMIVRKQAHKIHWRGKREEEEYDYETFQMFYTSTKKTITPKGRINSADFLNTLVKDTVQKESMKS